VDDLELAALIVGSYSKLAKRVGCSPQNINQAKGKPLPAELAGKIELAVRDAVAADPEAKARALQLGRMPTAEAMSPGNEYHRDAEGGLHLTLGRSSHPSMRRKSPARVSARALKHGRTSAPLSTCTR
jgi:DNA-binding transcriptional regulator YdaS (Cro superfamily)